MANKKSLALTENILKRAGINNYSELLNDLSHLVKYVHLNATEQNLNMLNKPLNTALNLLSCINFVQRRAIINNNPKIVESLSEVLELVDHHKLIYIVGRFGTGKTFLLNTILDNLFRNTDTLFISDTFDTARQVLNVNNNNADILPFYEDKEVIFKHLEHKNLLLDGIDDYLPELLPKIDVSITDKVILTSHVIETIRHNRATGQTPTAIMEFNEQLYSLAMDLKSELLIIDVSQGLENIKTHTL